MKRKQTIIYDLACQEMEIYLKRGHLQTKRDEYMGLSSMTANYQELLETYYACLHDNRDTCGYDYTKLFGMFKDHVASLRDLSIRIGEDMALVEEEDDFTFFNTLYEDINDIESRNTLWFRANETTVIHQREA